MCVEKSKPHRVDLRRVFVKLKKGPVPFYYQLERALRNRILTGQISPSELRPTERELCEEFGISRTTVRQALMILESEGLIRREQGRCRKGRSRSVGVRAGEGRGRSESKYQYGEETRGEPPPASASDLS